MSYTRGSRSILPFRDGRRRFVARARRRARNLVYTFIWSSIFGITFLLANVAMTARMPSIRAIALFAVKTAYFSIIPIIGVIAGMQGADWLFHIGFSGWLVTPEWLMSIVATSVVISLVLSTLFYLRVRMGPRLEYSVDVDASLSNYAIAPMLLQPVVENAIRHGLDPEVFWQIHRGTVVNMDEVASPRRDLTGRVFLRLKDGKTELTVSRAYAQEFKQM